MNVTKTTYPVTADGVVIGPKPGARGAFTTTQGLIRMGKHYITIVSPIEEKEGKFYITVMMAEFREWKELNDFLISQEAYVK